MLSKDQSDQPAMLFMYDEAKNHRFSTGQLLICIFHRIALDLYAYDLHKNAEKTGVISFLSQIFCRKAVRLFQVNQVTLYALTQVCFDQECEFF